MPIVLMDPWGEWPLRRHLSPLNRVPTSSGAIADHARGERLGTHVVNAENDSALLSAAAELGRQGRYTPRIEQSYPLEKIADAHAHAERGRTRGKIVISI